MRIGRLSLERYGHVSGEVLEFSGEHGLHVVVGANEAGKSTALEAVADGLFGFSRKHSRKFRHPDDPRIGFTLRAADGSEASFVRSSKRKDNLLDRAGQPVVEAALLRFLGGTTRERFSEVFGLDGERLRQGGRTILSEHGEAGAAVLQAQTGLHGLRDTVERLDAEAARLFGDGRGRRVISTAAAAVRDNRRLVSERSLSGGDYVKTAALEAGLTEQLSAIQQETRQLRAEQQQLDRIRRTASVRGAIAQAREEQAELGPAPDLPPDAAAQLDQAMRQAEQAMRDLVRDLEDAAHMEKERAALVHDPAILEEAGVVMELESRRLQIEDTVRDRIERSGEAAARLAAVDEAAARLEVTERGPALRRRIPGAATRGAAERLIQEQNTRLGRVEQAQVGLAAAGRRAKASEAALAAIPAVPDVAALQDAIAAAQAEGPIDRTLAGASAKSRTEAADLAAALSGLALWSGDAVRLEASPVPLDSEVRRLAAALADAEATHDHARDMLARQDQAHATARETVADEERAGPLPDAAAIAALRTRRDLAWHLIRRHHIEGQTVDMADWPETPAPALADLPDLLDRLLPEADAFADLRATEVARVQRWEDARATVQRLQADRPASIKALEQATSAHRAALADWREAWRPAGVDPLHPAAMRDWVRDREAVLATARQAREAARTLEDVTARHAGLVRRLRAALSEAGTDTTLAELRDRAVRRLNDAENHAKRHSAAEEEVRRANADLAKARGDVADLETAGEGWRARWAPVAARLGIDADADMLAATDALGRWTGLGTELDKWAALQTRVDEMTESIEGNDAARAALAARLGVLDEPGLVQALSARLRAAQATARERTGLVEKQTTLAHRIAAHERQAADAAAVLAGLRRRAGVADDAALKAAIARAAEQRLLAETIRARLTELHTLDDGMTEAALAGEVAGVERDAIPGRLTEIDARLDELDAGQASVTDARAEARRRLAEMAKGQDVAGPAQAVQDALVEIEEATHRYVRLRLSHALLRGGIERFRRTQQGPLLAKASGFFAALTGGRYDRLEPDEGDKGEQIIVAVRADGTTCPADMLSEGTCDQLFLALRLASISMDAAAAEPLPFIADDLLVNFDDRRARAALGLLAEFGRETQVILFTHHEHLLSLVDRDGASVHRLPRELA